MLKDIVQTSTKDFKSWLPGIFSSTPVISGNYRFYVVSSCSYLIGLLIHLLFIPMFWFFGVTIMTLYNVVSITAFAIAYILNRKTYHNLALIIAATEISIHASLAVYSIGWHGGFFVYLLALVPLVFFNPVWGYGIKIGLSTFFTVLYIGLKVYSNSHAPLIELSADYLTFSYYINSAFVFVLLAYLSYFYSLAANQAESALQQSYDEIQILAKTDPLTRLANRRGTIDAIDKEVSRFNRTNIEFAIILADIDNFKKFNDHFGHDCGDFVLITVANTIKHVLRDNDHIGRWGGEEFLILLPETRHDGAQYVAEKIRRTLSDKTLTFRNTESKISMTFGISIYNGCESVATCINNADKNLYKGKQRGKNCVIPMTV